ncbi:hypothetical protein M569_10842, partial [Genlisea aurea]
NNGRRPQTRQALSLVNVGQDAPPSNAVNSESDCVAMEFTAEDVESLLNEKLKKSRLNHKENSEKMSEYIKRLKLCIKWFQQLEMKHNSEQENLKNLLDLADKKCSDTELMMKEKEDELNSNITLLRKDLHALKEKLSVEELEKSKALDSMTEEKEFRIAAERQQASISEELKRSQEECSNANQKLQSLDDMHKRVQEYNNSLQQYNTKLQSDLNRTQENLQRVEKEKAAAVEILSTVRGQNSSLQEQLTSCRGMYDEVVRERETLRSEVTSIRGDLNQVRDDRDRQLQQAQLLSSDVIKYRECAEKSIASLELLTKESYDLESRCASQSETIKTLSEQLACAEKKLQLSDMSSIETRSHFAEQHALIADLKNRLAEADLKIFEGEKLRKKLHNTIL